MMNFALRSRLQVVLCGLLLVQNLGFGVSSEKAGAKDAVRKLQGGLADYQRFTPRPTPAASNVTAPADTPSPTTLAPTKAPTDAPSKAPTDAPTDAPTVAPTDEPTKAPKNEEEVTEPPEETATEPPDPTQPPTQDMSKWDLYSTPSQEYTDSLGSLSVDFSLYSPNITNEEMNFEKVKKGVCGSIDGLVCDPEHPVREEGTDYQYCAVLDEVLLRDGAERALQEGDSDATVMALASTHVKDDSGLVQGLTSVSWTTWRMSWDVLELSPALRARIEEMYGADLEEAEINKKAVEMVQRMMTVNMESSLTDGGLQKDINDFMKDITLFASVAGEEIKTYGPLVVVEKEEEAPSVPAAGEEVANGEDGDGGGLMVVLFFAGLGVACFVIVALLYFSFRSRRSKLRRKRTIVILDDTSKESGEKTGASPGTSQEESNKEASQEKVMVMETEGALEEELARDQEENNDQQWGEEASLVEGEDVEADVESQWGRSAAHSAYTGSISAITGVSGLEQSDTWSVGSMSIDLAEWG